MFFYQVAHNQNGRMEQLNLMMIEKERGFFICNNDLSVFMNNDETVSFIEILQLRAEL